MQIKVEIKGLKEAIIAMGNSPKILSNRLNRAINTAIIKIRDESAVRTPVDTGRLRGSYEMKFGNLYGETGPTANYGIYVHEGTRYMKARPFMSEGIQASKVQDIFNKEIEGAMEDIAKQAR